MDPANLIGELVEKGTLGVLLAASLWANLKLYQQIRDEHSKRLQDAKDSTQALLEQNEKVHTALTSVSNLLETTMKPPK